MIDVMETIVARKTGDSAPYLFNYIISLHKRTMYLELVILLTIRKGDLLLLVVRFCYSDMATLLF